MLRSVLIAILAGLLPACSSSVSSRSLSGSDSEGMGGAPVASPLPPLPDATDAIAYPGAYPDEPVQPPVPGEPEGIPLPDDPLLPEPVAPGESAPTTEWPAQPQPPSSTDAPYPTPPSTDAPATTYWYAEPSGAQPPSWTSAPSSACCGQDLCNPCCPRTYLGGTFDLGAGIGGGVEAGREFYVGRTSRWAVEGHLTYQDLWEDLVDESLTGKFTQFRAGLKASVWADRPVHPTVRAGLTWFSATGDTEAVDEFADIPSRGDYAGGYVGLGLEWDVDRHFTTGPELAATGAFHVEDGDFAWVLQLKWHFIFRF